ncbi:unnamed protein product [Owenia fusiformis]|uniref:Fucosyltransferase n=1 Tax=Owenia fusiformis TaxID=6347 RepID=A0A8J1UJ15_OWEFU|nr:unnamed protein product [Owenia fusiformis]
MKNMNNTSFKKSLFLIFVSCVTFTVIIALLLLANSVTFWPVKPLQAPHIRKKYDMDKTQALQAPHETQALKVLRNRGYHVYNATYELQRNLNGIQKTKSKKTEPYKKDRKIKILIWTTFFRKRYYVKGERILKDSNCSIKHCNVHYDKSEAGIASSDAVLFHLWGRDFKIGDPIPKIRYSWQNYIFFSMENPTWIHFTTKVKYLDGFFNLTATYKQNSDVPLAYGKYFPRDMSKPTNLKNYYMENRRKRKDKDAIILWVVSNCKTVNNRMQFVKKLQKHIAIDIFGRCGKPCKRHTKCGTHSYMFYMALENADCKDYITEKLWHNSFGANLIPVVQGSKVEYSKHLPPNSFIHVDTFNSVKDLAMYITKVSHNETLYNSYFKWKELYQSTYNGGLRNPDNFCKLCTVLHERRQNTSFNKEYKISSWFDWKNQCARRVKVLH